MNVKIRDALPTDQIELNAIFMACRKQDFSWLPGDIMCLDDFAQASKDERIFVAEREDGVLLGFLSLWEPANFIHFLFIHPHYQGNRVANRLVEYLFPLYLQPFRLKCLEKNSRALHYYRREGWMEVGRGVDVDGEHRVFELVRPI